MVRAGNPGSQNQDTGHREEIKAAQNKKGCAVLSIASSESWKSVMGEY
jgi:hypothetical protein